MKMKRADLERRAAELDQEHTLYLLAVQDLVTKQVRWFRHGSYRVGISRWNTGSGGVCIAVFTCHGQTPSTHVYYLEKLEAHLRGFSTTTPEGLDLRQALFKARTWINQQRQKA